MARFFLMLLESTVIPVPSELVVAPASYMAADGSMHAWLVVLFATLGADCGATINYLAGYYLGQAYHLSVCLQHAGQVMPSVARKGAKEREIL